MLRGWGHAYCTEDLVLQHFLLCIDELGGPYLYRQQGIPRNIPPCQTLTPSFAGITGKTLSKVVEIMQTGQLERNKVIVKLIGDGLEFKCCMSCAGSTCTGLKDIEHANISALQHYLSFSSKNSNARQQFT